MQDVPDDRPGPPPHAPPPGEGPRPAATGALGEGARVGGYRLGERLGEGGMGVVWAATQESPRREVALKLVRPGPDFAEHRRRFEYEAEVLGWLNHPAIAQIYEAGVADTPTGPQPYFAMERVHGEPLDAHVARHRPSLRERLELFVAICDGVQHAHRKGVLHRDLKPGNLLVQADGRPKVLDFGVARALDADAEATALRTATGELVGTLAYMSPEQVQGDPTRLDVRADVHALGIVLYEMLAGRRAFDLGATPLPEAVRVVLEDTPPRLSAAAPGTPTDVETIVAKAIEKDPARRYGSVDELADDVRRFLADEPIRARPASAVYHVSKFVRRNRLLVGSLALLFGLLLAGVGISSDRYVREQRARELSDAAEGEARRRVQRVIETNRTFEDLLVAPFPDQDGREVRMADVLRRAAHEARGEFADAPLQRAWLLQSLGQAFLALRLPEEAGPLLEEALAAMLEPTPGTSVTDLDRVARANLRVRLAETRTDLGRLDEAGALLDAAEADLADLDGTQAVLARHGLELGRAHRLATRGGDGDEVRVGDHLERAFEALQEAGGDRPQDVAAVLAARARHLLRLGEPQRAEADARAALARLEDNGLEHTDDAAEFLHTLGEALRRQGRAGDAVEPMRRAIERAAEAFGPDHAALAARRTELGDLLRSLDRQDEARAQLEAAHATLERLGADPGPLLAGTLASLGALDLEQGEPERGVARLLEARAVLDALEGEGPGTGSLEALRARVDDRLEAAPDAADPAEEPER